MRREVRATLRPCSRPASSPGPRKEPQKTAPTPEQIAKIVTAKLKSPVGMPDKAKRALRVVLPRTVIEGLMAPAPREGYPSLTAWVQAVLAPGAGYRRRHRNHVRAKAYWPRAAWSPG